MSRVDEPPTPQPRVAPEALTWCISSWVLSGYVVRGLIQSKAHAMRVGEDGKHYALCGGGPIPHSPERCEIAPEGWPACRTCTKKARVDVPSAFRNA